MTELDRLGRRHAKLQDDIKAVRAELAPLIRAEHAQAGATFTDLMVRSGYKSVETIRQIIHPKTRENINKKRRGEEPGTNDVSATEA